MQTNVVGPVGLKATRLGRVKHRASRMSRRARLVALGMVAAVALIPVASTFASTGAQVVKTQGSTPANYSVNACGATIAFSASQHYNTTWTYTAKGQLNFHWVANLEGTATFKGATYKWLQNAHEIDHLDVRVPNTGLPGFNYDGTPNLMPYGGSLQRWLADPANFSHVDQISALFYDRLVLQGSGNKLQNQFVISVNENGNPNALQLRYVKGLC